MFTQLLAPPTCLGCGRTGANWCTDCKNTSPRACRRRLSSGLEVASTYSFEGPVRRAIIEWKEEGRRTAREVVAEWFRTGLTPLLAEYPDAVLVPVPSSGRSDRLRGSRLLYETVVEALPRANVAYLLRAVRERRDQQGLGMRERMRNLSESIAAHDVTRQTIILVDDLITTGATFRECERAILAQCSTFVCAFAIAHRN